MHMADIAVTPTMRLSGYHLPDLYRLEDIKYMINRKKNQVYTNNNLNNYNI